MVLLIVRSEIEIFAPEAMKAGADVPKKLVLRTPVGAVTVTFVLLKLIS